MVRIFYIWQKRNDLNWFQKLITDINPFDIIASKNDVLALEEARRRWPKEEITHVTLSDLLIPDIYHLQHSMKEQIKTSRKKQRGYKQTLRRLGKDKIGK